MMMVSTINNNMLYYASVNKITLIIGNQCNLSCKYCTYSSDRKPKKEDITSGNKKVFAFIKKIAMIQRKKLTIVITGGEPLLYFEQIVELHKHIGKYHPTIILETNGVLLNKEIVNFLNQNNIITIVGWEGRNTVLIRGKDVFDDDDQKKIIFAINNLVIQGMITSLSYPLNLCSDIQRLVEEYISVNRSGNIDVNFEEVIIRNNEYFPEIDYQQIKNEFNLLLNEYYSQFDTAKINCDDSMFSKTRFLSKYLMHSQSKNECVSVKLDTLLIDLYGYLYNVNCSIKNRQMFALGSVDELTMKDYALKSLEIENNIEKYGEKCKQCLYRTFCFNRKRLLFAESISENINYHCRFKEAVGSVIFERFNTAKETQLDL